MKKSKLAFSILNFQFSIPNRLGIRRTNLIIVGYVGPVRQRNALTQEKGRKEELLNWTFSLIGAF